MPAEDINVLPLNPGPLVLVVDDEASPRATLTRWIDALGYQVRSCPSGPAALRFLKAHRGEARLLLTDLAMPRMDGGELVERAKDLDPTLIAVLMAAPGDQPAGELLPGYRDLAFVPKPVNFADLAQKLELLLGIPATPTRPLPSMDRTRSRPRRTSGHHQV
jgi:CheY-like chemotaxis protein